MTSNRFALALAAAMLGGAAGNPWPQAYHDVGRAGRLVALDPAGADRWSAAVSNGAREAVVGGDGTIYYSESSGILAFDPQGAQLWRYPESLTWRVRFAIFTGGGLIASNDTTVYAFGPP
jgi:hypothetical protein